MHKRRPLAAVAMILAFMAGFVVMGLWGDPAGAEISDAPQSFWGVTNIAPGTTTNVQAEVWAIEQVGNTVYVGGKFLEVAGNGTHDQPYLAAFHADTGRWIDWWRPELNGPVYALQASADGTKLFVGGEFTSVNSQPIAAFAALTPATGQTVSGWTTRISGGGPAVVRDFDLEGGDLYIAGSFTTVAKNGVQTPVHRAARVNGTNGDVDTTWKPIVEGGGVWSIAASPGAGRVYLAGFFTSVNSDPDAAWGAILDASTGSPVPGLMHTSNNSSNPYQQAVEATNGLVFFGGSQHNVNVYRESDMALIRSHMTRAGGDIQDMEVVGDRLYVSCHCWNFNYDYTEMQMWSVPHPDADEHPVRGIFAIDTTTGAHDPDFFVDMTGSSGPWAIHGNASDGCLWTGGDMTTAGGTPIGAFTRLCDSAGPGPATGPQLTPPAPLSCAATTVNNSSVELNWSAVDHATAYVIYRDGQWIDRVDDPDQTSYTDTEVVVGAQYDYEVATNGGGNNSLPRRECASGVGVSVLAVSSCAASENAGVVTVDWVRTAEDNATRFVVTRSRNGGAYFNAGAVPVPGLSFSDATVATGNSYDYVVVAAAGAAEAPATQCTPTIDIAAPGPLAPTACGAAGDASGITVDWTRAASDNATAFAIRRSKNGGPFYWAKRLDAPATTWVDLNVVPGNGYAYTVETIGAGSVSNGTTCGEVQIAGQSILAVSSCTATETPGGIEIAWTRRANDNAVRFVLYRSRNNGTFYWAGSAAVPVTTKLDTNVSVGSTYTYRVRTVGANGNSADVTCSPPVTFNGVSIDPIAPVSCTATRVGNNAQVQWQRATDDNADSFVIRRSRNNGTFYWAGRVDAPGTSFANGGMTSGSYTYRIETLTGSETSTPTVCSGTVVL